ncbi:MAG: acyl-CoA mutase large subunit family protein, partial [Planctomycetota bacterium]
MSGSSPSQKQEPAPGEPLFAEFTGSTWDEWKREAERLLKGASFEKRLKTRTLEGFLLEPIYKADNLAGLSHVDTFPGTPPYVRGFPLLRDKQSPWWIAQEISSPSIDEARNELSRELERGATAAILCIDRAGRQGLDPESAADGTVGRGGVSIATAAELAEVLEDIDPGKVPIWLKVGSSGMACLGFYIVAAENRGIASERLSNAVAMDPLAEWIREGALPLTMEKAFDEMAEMTAWARKHAPAVGTTWVHGEVFHDGGAHAVQELAFSLAAAVQYLRSLEERDLAPERSIPHFRFSFSLGSQFFMEVAKLRAARLLWNRVLHACEVPVEQRSFRMHCSTSGFAATRIDPHVNLLRATTQALSGIVGGADSLCVAPFDAPFRQPDRFSRRIARNIQLILKDEAHLKEIMDPAAGSWYVERLTHELAHAAWELFRKVEGMGGMVEALEQGFPQAEVAKTAAQRRDALCVRRDILVGTNQYPAADEESLEAKPFDEAAFRKSRSAAIKKIKEQFPGSERSEVLKKLEGIKPDRTGA